MVQRKTQTPAYWQGQFTLSHKDLEFIYNQILEENRIFQLDDIALTLVRRQCQAEEMAAHSEFQQGKLYQPKEKFAVGETVVFPALDFALGTVQQTRPGHHPVYGNFTVINVAFETAGVTREFVTDFHQPHPLNLDSAQTFSTIQGLMSPEEIFETYRDAIRARVQAVLDGGKDFIRFHDQYFLRDLLPGFHEGLFNIADAAIDINNGPLSVDALIEHVGLEISEIQRFSVSCRLANDERFDDVGPSGQVLWYLKRIEPVEAHQQPERLKIDDARPYHINLFDETLLSLLAEIDDEATSPQDIPVMGANMNSVTLVLNYPHRRVGSLPLTPKTQSFFPVSYFNPVLFQFIDGRTGNHFPGWTVLDGKYIFGLEDWYNRNKLPVGAYLILKRTNNPLQVIIDYQVTRPQRDWVRTAAVNGNKLGFQMGKEAINCRYDELMIVGDANQAQTDTLWSHRQERPFSTFDLLCQLFPELSKLNPQSTVHAKTLYSAVNVVRRVGPGVIFEELMKHRCFISMGNGYWTFDPGLRD